MNPQLGGLPFAAADGDGTILPGMTTLPYIHVCGGCDIKKQFTPFVLFFTAQRQTKYSERTHRDNRLGFPKKNHSKIATDVLLGFLRHPDFSCGLFAQKKRKKNKKVASSKLAEEEYVARARGLVPNWL